MKILILSQVFWPDTASTAQHLSDLAFKLSRHSHEVRIITSRNNYEDPKIRYQHLEVKDGVSITRIRNTAFGKRNIVSRLADFFSFNFLLLLRLFRVSRKNTDIILGMTSPPLVSFIGILFARAKAIPFHYWTMDLQPELSISSGLIRKHSIAAKLFSAMGNYIFRHAANIIVLDRYMKDYVVRRGGDPAKVHIVPVWPVLEGIYDGARNENPFRIGNGFGDRIVVMYSGNHSYIHPLDTLLGAALLLQDDPRFLFVFVGEGVRKKDVTAFKALHRLDSIIQLKYQPRNMIHISLAAADIQVVIMGENQVGFTHPNKVYGSMFASKPVLYIGPEHSHVTDIIREEEGNIIVAHGQVSALSRKLKAFAGRTEEERNNTGLHNKQVAYSDFHPEVLKEQMYDLITAE